MFCCFIEVTMTVVKSVSDGLRDFESETQLNLNRPHRISAGPRHLSLPLTTEMADGPCRDPSTQPPCSCEHQHTKPSLA